MPDSAALAVTVGDWLAGHADLPRRDLEVLLCRAAGLTRAQVLAHPERTLSPTLADTLRAWARRRRGGEPVAYILGHREFWGLALEVTPAVLVPRPETELLVEVALTLAAGFRASGEPRQVLELGTGSGAVAIALTHESRARGLPLQITATDLSAPALAVARRNGRRLDANVRWRHGDWFAAADGRYTLILSNPPYVAEGDRHLAALRHEPRGALVSGPDGLNALRAIVAGAPHHLLPGGAVAVEHGSAQGSAVTSLCRRAGFTDIETLQDLAGLDRVTRGRLPEAP